MRKFDDLINNTECEVDLEGKRTLANSPLPPEIESAVNNFPWSAQQSFSQWVEGDFLNRLEALKRHLPAGAALSSDIKTDIMFHLMRHAAYDRAQRHHNRRIGLAPHHTFRALNTAKKYGLFLKANPDFFLFDIYGECIDRSGLVGLNWDPAFFYNLRKEQVRYFSGDEYKKELLPKQNPVAEAVFERIVREAIPIVKPNLRFSDSHRLSVYLTRRSPLKEIGRIPENPEVDWLGFTAESLASLTEAVLLASGLEIPPRLPSRRVWTPQPSSHQAS